MGIRDDRGVIAALVALVVFTVLILVVVLSWDGSQDSTAALSVSEQGSTPSLDGTSDSVATSVTTTAAITSSVETSTTRPVAAATTAAPVPTEGPDLRVAGDLIYALPITGEAAERPLDIYSAAGTDDAHPVVVLLHGGGATKNSAEVVAVAGALAEAGLVVVVPTHAGTGARTPDAMVANEGRRMREALEDTLCAVRYASQNAGDYGGDSSRISIVGHSAGGFLGLISFLGDSAIEDDWTGFEVVGGPPAQVRCVADDEDDPALTGFVGYNAAAFVFLMSGLPESNPDLWRLANPRTYVSSGSESVRFIIGGNDTLTPAWHVEEVESFAGELRAGGRDADVVLIEEAGHGWRTDGSIWARTLETILTVTGAG